IQASRASYRHDCEPRCFVIGRAINVETMGLPRRGHNSRSIQSENGSCSCVGKRLQHCAASDSGHGLVVKDLTGGGRFVILKTLWNRKALLQGYGCETASAAWPLCSQPSP